VDIGILGINKPSGITSFDVVKTIKRQLGIKKIGHGGTLDPMAEGVLPILIGEATCFFDVLLQSPKKYKTIIQLGASTDTDDKEGKIIKIFPIKKYKDEEIKYAAQQLTGTIKQIPPQYSALKINGKKAYKLAREGKKIELQARDVIIYQWDDIQYCSISNTISAEITCGSGTYIRALARDLARLLDTGGYLIELKRLISGGINIVDSLNLADLNDQWNNYLISPEKALEFLPAIEWKGSLEYLIHGKLLLPDYCNNYPQENNIYRLMFKEKIIALVEYDNNKLKYKKNLANVYKFL